MTVLNIMQAQSDASENGPVQFRANMAPRYAVLLEMALAELPEGTTKEFIKEEILRGEAV